MLLKGGMYKTKVVGGVMKRGLSRRGVVQNRSCGNVGCTKGGCTKVECTKGFVQIGSCGNIVPL